MINFNYFNCYDYEDEEMNIKAPYYSVLYVDDLGKRHLATISFENKDYLTFVKERFIVLEVKAVEE